MSRDLLNYNDKLAKKRYKGSQASYLLSCTQHWMLKKKENIRHHWCTYRRE